MTSKRTLVIEVLESVKDNVVCIGGSRAQRDLVRNTLISAYLQDGQPDAARQLIEEELDRKPIH